MLRRTRTLLCQNHASENHTTGPSLERPLCFLDRSWASVGHVLIALLKKRPHGPTWATWAHIGFVMSLPTQAHMGTQMGVAAVVNKVSKPEGNKATVR